MANFLQVVGRQATYIKDFNLNNHTVSITLATGNGPVIVFWSDSVRVNTKLLKPYTKGSSVLRDWEGKNISLTSGALLDTNKIYYFEK